MKDKTVIEWLRAVKANGFPKMHLVCHPQKYWHRGNKIDQVLKFENLNEDFKTLPFIQPSVELPLRNNTRPHRPPAKEMLCDEAVALVNELYAIDFDYLGYERIEV